MVSRTLAVLFTVFALLSEAQAADLAGQIRGRVLDTDGTAVPGTLLTVTSPTMIGPRQAETNDEGEFLLTQLPTGDVPGRGGEARVQHLGHRGRAGEPRRHDHAHRDDGSLAERRGGDRHHRHAARRRRREGARRREPHRGAAPRPAHGGPRLPVRRGRHPRRRGLGQREHARRHGQRQPVLPRRREHHRPGDQHLLDEHELRRHPRAAGHHRRHGRGVRSLAWAAR
jgi:hypothetical protein